MTINYNTKIMSDNTKKFTTPLIKSSPKHIKKQLFNDTLLYSKICYWIGIFLYNFYVLINFIKNLLSKCNISLI